MITIYDILTHKYPQLNSPDDFQVGQLEDGTIAITEWGTELVAQPTNEELAAWLADNSLVAEIKLAQWLPLLNNYVDNKAKEKGYNDAVSIATYKQSTLPSWVAEAEAFVTWRDQVWLAALDAQASILAGTMVMPATFADFIATLPALVWPEQVPVQDLEE